MGRRQFEYARWALGVGLLAAVVHLWLGRAVLAVLLGDRWHPDAQLALDLSVATTAVAAIACIGSHDESSPTSRMLRTLARTWRWMPPFSATVASVLLTPISALDPTDLGLLQRAVAVTCASATAAWIASLPCHAVLRSGSRAARPVDATTPQNWPQARRQWRLHAEIFATASAAATFFAVGTMVVSAPTMAELIPRVAFSITLATIVAVLVVVSAWSLGQTPSKDIASLGHQIDRLGNDAWRQASAPWIATTSDDVSTLFVTLEGIRQELCAGMGLYQRAHDQTQEAEARKSDFLSAVSHELRTPLNVVGGFAQVLLESPPSALSPAQREDVTLIRAGGNQLLALINDILDLSIMESGELQLHYARCQATHVIDEVADIHRGLLRDRNVTLEKHYAPELPELVCDRRRLSQILTNLISNAIKFTERGSIALSAIYDSNMLVVRCSDSGVGIEPHDLDGIFEEYRQAGTTKRRHLGTGLGLAIARNIAVHHGGSLTAESTIGVGSIFTLRLPLTPPAAGPQHDTDGRALQDTSRHSREGVAL